MEVTFCPKFEPTVQSYDLLSEPVSPLGAINAAQLGIADGMVPGIIIGVIGLAMAVVNYPIYKCILNSRKKKYSSQILELSERIMNR